MENIKYLISSLKRQLRAAGVTYQDVAQALGLSEASVKRMFSTQNFTLKRLQIICRLAQLDIVDLVMASESERSRIKQLTLAQEEELVSDTRLLLVALCVRHYWCFDDIVSHYNIDKHQCIQLLAKLDRLKLIELLPGNRIKLMVDHDFTWIAKGPIEKFYKQQVQSEFLKNRFDDSDALRLYCHAMLAPESIAHIRRKLQGLAGEIAELQRADATLPVKERENMSLLVAMRSWEFSVFNDFRRKQTVFPR